MFEYNMRLFQISWHSTFNSKEEKIIQSQPLYFTSFSDELGGGGTVLLQHFLAFTVHRTTSAADHTFLNLLYF